jgi:hypothetical protein
MQDDAIATGAADELLRRQELLQREAGDVLVDLDLINLLAPAGEVTQVGSSAMSLMMQRDIDICVVCDALCVDAAFEAARPIVAHPRVRKLTFLNETGVFKPAGLKEGLYWGVHYEADSGAAWKLDIWFWLRTSTPGDVEYAAEMRQRLTPETRVAILWIKDDCWQRGVYGDTVRSMDVYDAVLNHGVRTPGAFERWLAAHREQAPGALPQGSVL